MLDWESIETNGRAKPLWDEIAKHSDDLIQDKRIPGLALMGTQGAGKSLALWTLAKAAAKGFWDNEKNYEPACNTFGELTHLQLKRPHPIVAAKFRDLLRMVPPSENQAHWNSDYPIELAENNRLFFIDDMTFDPAAPMYQWARQFVFDFMDTLSDRIPDSFSLYLTTNNSYEDLERSLGAQTVDRIRGMCEPMICEWDSFR